MKQFRILTDPATYDAALTLAGLLTPHPMSQRIETHEHEDSAAVLAHALEQDYTQRDAPTAVDTINGPTIAGQYDVYMLPLTYRALRAAMRHNHHAHAVAIIRPEGSALNTNDVTAALNRGILDLTALASPQTRRTVDAGLLWARPGSDARHALHRLNTAGILTPEQWAPHAPKPAEVNR